MKFEMYYRFAEIFRRHGLFNIFLIIFNRIEGFYFDFRYGTDTSERVLLSDLQISSNKKAFGTKYDPSPISAIRILLKNIPSKESCGFVDFGAGKGRVLLVASDFRFKRVAGVEFSQELCSIAINNIKKYKYFLSEPLSSVEMYNIDATDYRIKKDDSVFFFFNPFGPEVFRTVLDNIVKSFNENARDITIIYCNPVNADLFNEYDSIDLIKSIACFGRIFNIYSIKS